MVFGFPSRAVRQARRDHRAAAREAEARDGEMAAVFFRGLERAGKQSDAVMRNEPVTAEVFRGEANADLKTATRLMLPRGARA